MIFQEKNMHSSDVNQELTHNIYETPSFSWCLLTFIEENEEDGVQITHNDHKKGIWDN